MSEFTRGPWELVGLQGTAVWAGDKIIASVAAARVNPKQARADARLIAAAPDLFNALTVLADACASRGIPVDAARLALAKASS